MTPHAPTPTPAAAKSTPAIATTDVPPTGDGMLRAWCVVALLCVVGALNYLDRNMITTMRPSIVAAIPMTDAQFGLLTSAFLWVYGILSPFAGYLADRFSRSRVIIASLVAWSALTWLTAHARTFEQLFIARALMGVSEACFIPGALALIADYHRGSTRSRATSILVAGVMVGSALGGMGGWLADRRGWTFPFFLFGLFGIVYAVFLAFVLRDRPGAHAARPTRVPAPRVALAGALVSLMRDGRFIRALIAWSLVGISGWVLVGWAPTLFQEHFHLTQGEAGLSVTAYLNGGGLVGVLLGGMIADRWSRTNSRARILLPALGLCLAAPGVVLTHLAPVAALSLAGLVIYGVTRYFIDANMMPILCQIADERYRATGYGVLNLFSCIIGGLGVYAGGMLRDARIGMGSLFDAVAIGLVFAAALLFSIKPSRTT